MYITKMHSPIINISVSFIVNSYWFQKNPFGVGEWQLKRPGSKEPIFPQKFQRVYPLFDLLKTIELQNIKTTKMPKQRGSRPSKSLRN
jgi:hypothetical protein